MQRLVSDLRGSAFCGSTFWLRPNTFDCAIQSGKGAPSRCRPAADAAAHAAKARPNCSLVVMWFGVVCTIHDSNHALRAADRAYLLRGGERHAEGLQALHFARRWSNQSIRTCGAKLTTSVDRGKADRALRRIEVRNDPTRNTSRRSLSRSIPPGLLSRNTLSAQRPSLSSQQ